MGRRNPPGTGMLRLSAAVLFVAGPILALIFRPWGLGAKPRHGRRYTYPSLGWQKNVQNLVRFVTFEETLMVEDPTKQGFKDMNLCSPFHEKVVFVKPTGRL
jgi:hypothetical protein